MATPSTFFSGIPQVDFELGGHQFKLPLFYRDVSSVTAIFPAKAGALAEVLPHAGLSVTTIAPGVAAVAVSIFEYRDSDIGPYNEMAVSIPVTFEKRSLPLGTLLAQMRSRTLSAYVWHLPVTTEVARLGGVEIYGYPKIVANIEFEATAGRFSAVLRDEHRRVVGLSGELPQREQVGARIRYITYAMKQGRLIEAQVLVQAQALAETNRPSGIRLELDDTHPIGKDLARVLLVRRPIMVQWMPRFQSVLHAPTFLE